MALSNPRILYGVHSVSPYSRTTGLPYGMLRVLAGSTFEMSGDQQTLFGGSFRFPWAVENGEINATLTINTKEYPDFLFTLFLGKAPTSIAADTNGDVSGLANVSGVSLFDASTGIATATIESGEEADLKFGKYIIKYVSATTVDVYLLSDVDANRGTDIAYVDDALKITASALTITSSTAVSIPNTGVELTGGSGTIALAAGDTAEFMVLPIHTGGMEVSIGGSADEFLEFGAILMSSKRATGELFEIDVYRAVGNGLSLGADEKAFSESSITATAFYDSAKNAICKIRAIDA